MPLILTSQAVNQIIGDISHANSFASAIVTGLTTPFSAPHRISTTAPNGTTTLFMPCTREPTTSLKTVSLPPGSSPNATITLHDSASGNLTAVLPGSEITAFRTALTSLLLLKRRTEAGIRCSRVVIMGAGAQARWLFKLLPWATGNSDLSVSIYSRSGPESVKQRIPGDYDAVSSRDELHLSIVSADAVFCCTPSTEPLFPVEWLADGVKKYVSCIGSYKPHMMEVDPKLLTTKGWQVCVDSKEACFVESGEIIKSGVGKEEVEEVARVVKEESLEEKWLGNVLFKCVGVAIMDLVTGEETVRIAREMDAGLEMRGFQ